MFQIQAGSRTDNPEDVGPLQGVWAAPWMLCQAVAEGKQATDKLVLACLSCRHSLLHDSR